MDTLEITGTTYGTPRVQWAAEANAGTSTGRGIMPSYVYLEQPTSDVVGGASVDIWSAFTKCWELVRLSQRTPWRVIMAPEFTRSSTPPATLVAPRDGAAIEAPIGDVEMLGRVKHCFSLNTSELAAVLNVGRPTVYAWMQGGPIRPGNQERLAAIYRIAQSWWKRAGQPLGSFLQLRGADGQSLLDLLKSELLDETKLEPYFKVAARRLERAAQATDERAEPYSAIAQRHGFAPVPGAVRDRALRQFRQGGMRT